MPTRNLSDSCSLLQEAVPKIIGAYNGRYGGLFTAKVGEVLRTTAEQQAKYAQGRTQPGKIITRANGTSELSSHQQQMFHGEMASHAVDINIFRANGAYVGGEEGDEKAYLPLIGLAVAFETKSGGDWMKEDYPHLHCPWSKA